MYQFGVEISGEFETVVKRVIDELKKEGFGILTDIDVQATLKAKLNKDMLPYRILGACNPPFAHQAIETEPDIGLLLPCNVVVRENENGEITVAFMDPETVLGLVKHEKLTHLGATVKSKLQNVCQAVNSSFK